MDFDNKVSFIAGFIFTTATTITVLGFIQAAFLGLIGGFFGLLGKEAYYYVKGEYKIWIAYIHQKIKDKYDKSKTK